MDTIEWTVMQILECSYEDIHGKVKVCNTKLERQNIKEKRKYVDLLVFYKGEHILIELNNNFNGYYLRNLLYAFNIVLGHIKTSDNYLDYRGLEPTIILVNLNWYHKSLQNQVNVKEIPGRREVVLENPDDFPLDTSKEYLIKIININLDYYAKLSHNEINQKEKLWKLLTIENEEELDSIVNEEKLLTKYQNRLTDLSSNLEYRENIMSEEIEQILEDDRKYRTGVLVGEQQGIQQGISSRNTEIVINMVNKNMNLKDISEIVNLPIEEVQSIINNQKTE